MVMPGRLNQMSQKIYYGNSYRCPCRAITFSALPSLAIDLPELDHNSAITRHATDQEPAPCPMLPTTALP